MKHDAKRLLSVRNSEYDWYESGACAVGLRQSSKLHERPWYAVRDSAPVGGMDSRSSLLLKLAEPPATQTTELPSVVG